VIALSCNPPKPVVVAAPGLVDESLVIRLSSHAVKLIAAIVVRRPSSIPSVCVITDCSCISLTVEILLMVLDSGVAFFGNEIEIRLRGMGKRGLG